MRAMQLDAILEPLRPVTRDDPAPGPRQVRLRVEACAVCRTDLHIIDGDLAPPRLPLIPGHEIVGIVEAVGRAVTPSLIGRRVGVHWLGEACGTCPYCLAGRENLCDAPVFTGYTRDGGFATHALSNAGFLVELDGKADAVHQAPLLCAGVIGWRALRFAGSGLRVGFYGFGAAAHIATQIAVWSGQEVYAFTRPGDEAAQSFARQLGAKWVGSSEQKPPETLDAAIIFAPVGELVPAALAVVRKGGRVVCGGIHMSDIPAMPYSLLWPERELIAVANVTRQDAATFFQIAAAARVSTVTHVYPLDAVNDALQNLRNGTLTGAAVIVP
jgi:propanol-preferring alcohol dehydrogenase